MTSAEIISALSSLPSLRPENSSEAAWASGLSDGYDAEQIEQCLAGAMEIITVQREHFPENIFFDLKYVVVSLLTLAQDKAEPAAYIKESIQRIIRLHALFGRHSEIRFRYVHDFIYGYDWVKWVTRDPGRAVFHPFGIEFMSYMEQRGQELLEAIQSGDSTYIQIKEGHRNIFGFARDAASEEMLMKALAEAGELPINTWENNPTLDWQRPYFELRREKAASLGLLLD